jgi:hypothetical protein
MNPIIESLKKLISNHAQLLSERDRHARMVDDLTAEETKLLPEIDLTNDADFKKLSDLRLRRELAPRKAAQFQDGADEAEKKIIAEVVKLASELSPILSANLSKHREKVEKTLAVLISDKFQLGQAVDAVIGITDNYQTLAGWLFVCSNTASVGGWQTKVRARDLIAIAEKLADFKI